MIDLILPETDAGVAVQFAAVLTLGSAVVIVTWKRKEWRLVAIGLTLLVLGFFGMRALH